jgi:hypothetical protein
MIICPGDMGEGTMLFPTAVCGVNEGTVVGTIPSFAELQAVTINSPNKPLNTIINFFVISRHQLINDPSKNILLV